MMRHEDFGELSDAFGIAAFGESDEQLATNTQNVATLESARKRDVFQFAKFGNGVGERSGFGTARCSAERKNDSKFIENDGGILDEHGIGEIGFGGKRNDASAELFEEDFVRVVLGAGDL